MRVAGLLAASGCAGLALVLASCAAIFGFEPLFDREDEDASATSPADASTPALQSSCEPQRLPARPGRADGGSVGPPLELTFALDGLSLSPELGLNLDSRCTALDAAKDDTFLG